MKTYTTTYIEPLCLWEMQSLTKKNVEVFVKSWTLHAQKITYISEVHARMTKNNQTQDDVSVPKDCTDDYTEYFKLNCENDLLFVYQSWTMKHLMQCYGNNVVLLDSTYRTTRYSLPLFFLCVPTNITYMVINCLLYGSIWNSRSCWGGTKHAINMGSWLVAEVPDDWLLWGRVSSCTSHFSRYS